jgi:hypothetical protein
VVSCSHNNVSQDNDNVSQDNVSQALTTSNAPHAVVRLGDRIPQLFSSLADTIAIGLRMERAAMGELR